MPRIPKTYMYIMHLQGGHVRDGFKLTKNDLVRQYLRPGPSCETLENL